MHACCTRRRAVPDPDTGRSASASCHKPASSCWPALDMLSHGATAFRPRSLATQQTEQGTHQKSHVERLPVDNTPAALSPRRSASLHQPRRSRGRALKCHQPSWYLVQVPDGLRIGSSTSAPRWPVSALSLSAWRMTWPSRPRVAWLNACLFCTTK